MDVQRPACDACRTKKRKCDKAEPACSQCSIRAYDCVYSYSHVTSKKRKRPLPEYFPESHGVAVLPDVVSHHTPRHPTADAFELTLGVPPVQFPASSFLDRNIHRELRTRLPLPPKLNFDDAEVYDLGGVFKAGSLAHVSHLISGVQKWLPVFSDDKLRGYVDRAMHLTVDEALLLQCMGLIASKPLMWSDGSRTKLYLACKRGFSDLETAGILSIAGLEAALLISLYEINHAMYPAAFLTTGACARYGLAMGLGSSNKSRLCPPANRAEHEESKRLWWAVLLLNRFVALGHPTHSIIGDDPHDDKQVQSTLDSEEMAAANCLNRGNSGGRITGCVTLLMESTKLLGQVLVLLSSKHSDTQTPKGALQQDKQLLDRTIDSLIVAAEDEASKWNIDIEDQITICYSSLLALNQPDPASHLEGIQQSENNGAAVQLVTNKVLSRCRKILAAPEENFDSVSPFFIHSVYSVAVTSTVLGVEEPASSRSLIEKTLQKLNERWKLAGAYLELIQTQEVMRL